MRRQSPLESFYEPEPNTGCWIWFGSHSVKGYGEVATKREGCDSKRAHRVVYTFERGRIPPHLQLDHRCRNHWCVNPSHLEIVTCRENLMRGNTWAATNAAKTECPNGHPYSHVIAGSRVCMICIVDRNRARRARLRTA